MTDTIVAYPEFVPNQILTDRQLNQLYAYLDQEDCSTRVRLVGTGIYCGLFSRTLTTGTPSVEIEPGYGVTSDGYLIELCHYPAGDKTKPCNKTTYTHWRDYADPDKDEEGKFKYLPWRSADPKKQRDIIELISADAMAVADPLARPAGAVPFTNATLTQKTAGRVVVLYLEHQPVDLKSCLVTSCDNKGRNINVQVRALLVKTTDLAAMAGAPAVPTVFRIPRVTKSTLRAVTTRAQLLQAFTDVVNGQFAAVGTGITQLFDAHAPFLGEAAMGANPLAAILTGGTQTTQYQYDALLDFVCAYHEAAAAAFELIEECCPNGSFPRHLMLGMADGASTPGYRNEFVPAATRNVMHGELHRVRALFTRLTRMVLDLKLDPQPGAIVIRPSHSAAYPLGRRARPYYFPTTGVRDVWRPRRRGSAESDWPWTNPEVASSLGTDYAENTFLRIEGHVNQPWVAVQKNLTGARELGNAEFNLLFSFLDDAAADEAKARAAVIDALKPEAELMANLADVMRRWIVTPTDVKPAEIVAAAAEWETRLDTAAKASQSWADIRGRRPLQCEAGALAAEYLRARSELLCAGDRAVALIHRYSTDIGRLKDEQLTGEGLDAMTAGTSYTLARRLTDGVVASPGDWDTPEKVKKSLDAIKPSGRPALRSALVLGLNSIEASIDRMLADTLPSDLRAFDFERFSYAARRAVDRSREFWHWTRALGVRIPGASAAAEEKEPDPPLDRAEQDATVADWLGLRGCLLARFATIAAQYDAIRAADLSLYRNLVGVDGLEHLAGVKKGGTFIIVTEKTSADGKTIADFSLEGCLPCCCDPGDTLCIPPLAAIDVRIVRLPPADEKSKPVPIQLAINVIDNDSDLNGPPPHLKIEQRSARSELGAELKVDQAGIVHYALPAASARPGAVDRLEYGLVLTDTCQGKATGTVIVVVATEPAVAGGIKGHVLYSPNEFPPDALVTIKETLQTASATKTGLFVFDNVKAGTYTLSARAGNDVSGDVPVTVAAGHVTDNVELYLKKAGAPPQPSGIIAVAVRDAAGAALPGVTVTAVKTGDPQRAATTNAAGNAVITSLPAGQYVVSVTPVGLVVQRQTVTLADGQSLAVTFTFGSPTVVISGDTIRTIAGGRRLNVLDARTNVADLMRSRYATFVDTFNRATDDPTVTGSNPYKAAATFLSDKVTDPASTDDQVAASYKEVAAGLANAVAAAPNDAAKAPYRTALKAVTAAYFDRVAVANSTLSAERAVQAKEATDTLKTAGVPVAELGKLWNGQGLKDGTALASTDSLIRVVT